MKPKQTLRMKIKEIVRPWCVEVSPDVVDEILSLLSDELKGAIPEMKHFGFPKTGYEGEEIAFARQDAYNQAISDLRSDLKERNLIV